MTKNKAMRLGSVMLVLALLTTCAISGTFAKYTASSETNDTARVAYWGFSNSSTTTLDLFNHGDANVSSGGTVDDVSAVIAPGTSNSKDLTFSYTALNSTVKAPEVAYSFNVVAENTGDTTFLDDTAGFKWTLQIGDDAATEYGTTAALIDAINALSVTSVNANNLPSTIAKDDGTLKAVKIGWEWEFTDTTSDDATTTRDTADTKLGNAAEADLQNVKLNIKVTATQVD